MKLPSLFIVLMLTGCAVAPPPVNDVAAGRHPVTVAPFIPPPARTAWQPSRLPPVAAPKSSSKIIKPQALDRVGATHFVGQCGSKRYCTQMQSCEEARFYLSKCGLDKLDKDKDGIPCESLCGN